VNRRAFVTGVGAVLAAPLTGGAQQPAKAVRRVGVLIFRPTASQASQEAFRQDLRDRGYVEGQNILIEWRSADGRTDRANALATELVRLKVDVIVAEFTPTALAAKRATRTIPIVMAGAGDPVATGLVASLARPGGNVTGVSNIAAELSGKRLDLLREVVPGLTRAGLLIHGGDPLDKGFVSETQTAAAKAGIHINVARVPSSAQLESAFSALTKERVGAVIVQANVPVPAKQIADVALRHRLPSISLLNEFAESGGLMSYGVNVSEIYRRVADYVDKILKGAKPADLPVEQPTKFELIINLKTAKALGFTIPPSLLLRADQVIE
jgi:putative tryptophan/tyrosine transport system substrate-binding protein